MKATLKIYKQRKEASAVKPTNIYIETHEKLAALSAESGLPIVKLIAIFVNFAMDHVVITESESESINPSVSEVV